MKKILSMLSLALCLCLAVPIAHGQLQSFGTVSNSQGTPAAIATGTITFSAVGTAADTVTVNGVAFTAIAHGSTPTSVQFALGTDAPSSAASLAAQLTASTNASVTPMNFTVSGAVITVNADVGGTAGNAYTLAKSSTAVTVSAGTLAGGAVGVPGAMPSVVSYATAPVNLPVFHTVTSTFTGTAPAACTFKLQGSLDNVNWFDLANDATTTTVTCTGQTIGFYSNKALVYLRVYVVTYAAGDLTTVASFNLATGPPAITHYY